MSFELADFGSFYAGGRRHEVVDEPTEFVDLAPEIKKFPVVAKGTYALEACYVQYFIPKHIRGEPVLLLHGGGLTGACWETTPDGRPGWVQHLLQAGRPVYVADMMERGRASWVSLPGVWDGPAILRTEQEAWWLFRFGLAENYPTRAAFAGQRFPLAALDDFMKQAVPRWTKNAGKAFAAFEQALERIGPCSIISHSSGSVYGYRLAFEHPDMVKRVVSVEGSTWPADVPANLEGQCFLEVMGDFLDSGQFWQEMDGKVQAWSARLSAAGATADYWRLHDRGMKGHSHMLMMDHHNDVVLNDVLSWLDANS